MNMYSKRFNKILLSEQDDEVPVDDAAALDMELKDITSDDLGAKTPPGGVGIVSKQQRKMYEELSQWVRRLEEFAEYLNGTENNSIQSSLNSAEPDTLFDSISNAETKKIARVAMEVSSLSEILKGYLAGANNPKYRYN